MSGTTIDWGEHGGKSDGEGGINFGWIPHAQRTRYQKRAYEDAYNAMPQFRIRGKVDDSVKRVVLTDLWTHPQVVSAFGKAWTGTHQFTGSCVWAGYQNVITTLNMIETIRLGQPEKLSVPFGLMNYGRSRLYLGDSRPGEGSSGATMAKSAKEDGTPDTLPGLPKGTINEQGVDWSAAIEMAWSDGDARQTMDLLPEGRKHLVRTVSPLKDHNDVRDAIRSMFPVTNACSRYIGGASMRGGTQPVIVGDLDGNGGHQTSFLGWQEHPDLGELILYVNQWRWAYALSPDGIPRVACWTTPKTVDRICREDETYAFSQYDGMPADMFDWGTL